MPTRAAKISKLIARTRLIVERFEILRTLGSGGAGVVYHVRDRALGNRELALKVLANSSAFDNQTLKRFIRELEILKDIRHPNLIEAYDFIEVANLVAFTMEYVDGKDLGKLRHSQNLTHSEIDRIFAAILSALHELHSHGIAHRDIKLENILVSKQGLVKLSDLGIVKQLEKPGSTAKGILLGTTQYLPPEYVRFNHYDARGDIYAVGLMLYECLSGNRWLQHKPGQKAVEFLSDRNFEFPKVALSGLPRKYVNILECALAVDPTARYPKAELMQEAILSSTGVADRITPVEVKERLHLADYHELPVAALQANAIAKQRRLLFIVLIFLGLLITVGGAALFSIAQKGKNVHLTARPDSKQWEANICQLQEPFGLELYNANRTSPVEIGCSVDKLTQPNSVWACDPGNFQFSIPQIKPTPGLRP